MTTALSNRGGLLGTALAEVGTGEEDVLIWRLIVGYNSERQSRQVAGTV